MKKIAFIYDEQGEYAPREGFDFVKRDNIAAIIKFQNEYLLLEYNNVNYSRSLVTGGIEKDEDKTASVKREVIEETGYLDIESITPVDCINVSRFFVEHKHQNREATFYPFLVTLKSKQKVDIAVEEEQEHKCIWIDEKRIDEIDIFDNHRRMLNAAMENKIPQNVEEWS